MNKASDDEQLIRRNNALREWHRNPSLYPKPFQWHVEAGDFDHILTPELKRGAA